jgi:4-amino-4-deoxy-L-arabinose transferase-like glycosyltransferase
LRYRFAIVEPAERDTARLTGSERWLVALLALAVVAAICFQLGSRALYEPDEGRNAEVMREMSVSGDYLVPRLNGLLFLDKPFLYFAAGGLAVRLFGATELAVRLPGTLATLALALCVGALARRLWGPRAGLLAGLAAAATPLPILYSQIVIFDAMLTLWIALAVMALYLAVEREEAEAGATRASFRHWSWVAWCAMGLGVLTKGPVALLVPLAVALPWAIWRRRPGRLVERFAPLALLGVVLPWLWLVSRADPGFLHYALVTETWSRLTSNELKRDAPVWYYLPVALLGALPWSLVPLAGWRRIAEAWRSRRLEFRFLLLWFVLPFLLFSVMHSKRVHYILPLVPALVLLSIGLWLRTPAGERLPGVRAAGGVWSALGLALLALGLGAAPRLLERIDGAPVETVARVAVALGLAWAVAGGFALASSRSLPRAFCALNLPAVALLLLSTPLAAAVGERRSARELAADIRRDYTAGIEVVAVETFPASLPFYLERPLVMESVDGGHLRSNYILRRYPEMVSDSGPLRPPSWLAGAILDCETPRAFVVRRKNDGVRKLLAAAGRPNREAGRDFVVFGPCPPNAAGSAGVAPVVLQELAAPPPAELLPPPALEAGRVRE